MQHGWRLVEEGEKIEIIRNLTDENVKNIKNKIENKNVLEVINYTIPENLNYSKLSIRIKHPDYKIDSCVTAFGEK